MPIIFIIVQCLLEFLPYVLHIRGVLQDESSGFRTLSAISMGTFINALLASLVASFSVLGYLEANWVKDSEDFRKLDDTPIRENLMVGIDADEDCSPSPRFKSLIQNLFSSQYCCCFKAAE
jgi:hypothetical protein